MPSDVETHLSMKIILILLVLFQAGCREPNRDKEAINYTEKSEIRKLKSIDDNKLEIITKAKAFVEVCLEDSTLFFAGVEDLMGDNIEVEYLTEVDQWSLFFTDGINSVFVRLDKQLGRGNVKVNNGRFLGMEKEGSEESGFNPQERKESAPRLFSISEFITNYTFPGK